MTEQEVKPCEFANGACIHCDATNRGECEGWVCPPQRPWVGLTEDEIKIAWAQLWYDLNHGKLSAPDAEVRNNVVVFGRALEAMLKEQNT